MSDEGGRGLVGRATTWAVLSAGWATAVSLLLLVLPVGVSESASTSVRRGDGAKVISESRVVERFTLVEHEGWGAALVLLVPVVLTLCLWLAVRSPAWRVVGIVMAILLWMFVIVSGFSIGLFYVPSALGALLAVMVAWTRSPASQPG